MVRDRFRIRVRLRFIICCKLILFFKESNMQTPAGVIILTIGTISYRGHGTMSYRDNCPKGYG